MILRHLWRSPGTRTYPRSACGRKATTVLTTTNPAEVTCGQCRRVLAFEQKSAIGGPTAPWLALAIELWADAMRRFTRQPL